MWEIANIRKISKSSIENHLHQHGYVNHFDVWVPHKISRKSLFFFLAALGLCCCVRAFFFSLVATRRGYSSLQCAGFSLHWLLLLWSMGSRRAGFSSCGTGALEHAGFRVVARGLWSAGSVVAVHRLSCSASCGIFLDQGSNPSPLQW